ncbi:Bromodomain adjacent to zinc finger domain protein 1A [Trichostrongylus colubriformis]|uniref:Bromodomain adjacent to zinc finger domain protein 1A n=1 Tax=Trichostrongylus colubriformis TaxID=6319 RepID=A0AAN8ETX8_TRICO
MPLLNKKPIERCEVPANVKLTDKVFFLEASNEIFLTYDEFFERMIQLNSTLFSCEFTGKTGLTFFEALESERQAMKALGNFPPQLEQSVLYLVRKHLCRGRFEDLLNDVALFMKDRYFVGEECSYIDGNLRLPVRITGVTAVKDWQPENVNGKEPQVPPPDTFRYSVKFLEGNPLYPGSDSPENDNFDDLLLPHTSLHRARSVASKPKLKLYLKNSCLVRNERYDIKEKFISEIDALSWESICGGPLPHFPRTPMLQRGRQPKSATAALSASSSRFDSPSVEGTSETPKRSTKEGKSQGRKSETPRGLTEKKKNQIGIQQEELASMFESARKFGVDLSKYEQKTRLLSTSEIAELKLLIKSSRTQERELAREAKRMKMKAKHEWQKKRDDLDCDDLKALPVFPALTLPSWLSDDELSEYLVILQFFTAFQELLPIKEVRGTNRVSLTDVIMAIRCADPQYSTYADLMKILLSARTDRADEEDGDEADLTSKDEIALIQLQNCDPDHKIHGEKIREMNFLHEEIRLTHGQSIRHIPADWMTLTEALRLVLLTSGYYTGQSTHRHRLFARGNYKGYEDAGFVYRLKHPETMEKLRTSTVFDLTPAERLDLMKVIIYQLLSYNKFRSRQDDRLFELWEQRRELKKLRNWDLTQEQEAKDARLAREYELELIEEQGQEAAREQMKEWPAPSEDTLKLKQHLKAVQEARRFDRDEMEQMLLAGVAYSELDYNEVITARDLQREKVQEVEMKLLESIYNLTSIAGQLHLGRDRAFRNYFLLECVPCLIVENPIEADNVGVCSEATPIADSSEYGSEEATRQFVLGCSGNMNTCSVHGEGRKRRPRWTFVDSLEKVDKIVASCNSRGVREIDLADEITFFRPRIAEVMEKVETKLANGQFQALFMVGQPDPAEMQSGVEWPIELREVLLDLEEKMEQGLLGRLPAHIDRQTWRQILLETGDITSLMDRDVVVKGAQDDVVWTKDELPRLTEIQKLAVAFLQLVQCISLKFLQKPFSVTKVDETGRTIVMATPVFLRWQRALLMCDSIPAVCLFLSTLEPAIMWDKSRLQARCRACRRKANAEALVLCADCNRCYHFECARLGVGPAPLDWCCADCKAVRRKIAAAEKRKAQKEASAQEPEETFEDEHVGDENSLSVTMVDELSQNNGHGANSVIRTSSGRTVRRVQYTDSIMIPDTEPSPRPLKSSKRQSTRANGHSLIDFVADDDFDYDSESSSASRSKRKRKNTDEYTESPARNMAPILRDADLSSRARIEALENLIREAMKEPYAWPFLEPVDKRDVPDYYDVISRPMDLRTMINKIKQHIYDTPEEVRSDAYLIIANCKEYNEEGSEIFDCAEQLEDFFQDRFRTFFDEKKKKK